MKREGCDAVVLGCTEIPLIMNDANSPLPTLDSTRLLALAAVHRAVAEALRLRLEPSKLDVGSWQLRRRPETPFPPRDHHRRETVAQHVERRAQHVEQRRRCRG